MIDSHCHLDCLDLKGREHGMQSVLDEAKIHGVDGMLCISITLGNDAPRILAAQHESVWATVGLHPCHAHEYPDISVGQLKILAESAHVIALGETGLDGYHAPVSEHQLNSFKIHLQAGSDIGLPVVVHTREAPDETISQIKLYGSTQVPGVLHCFTESWDMAKQAMDLGYFISMSGIVSYPKATAVREVCQQIPRDRLLIETDAPWLAPVPYRGKANEPAFVRYVAEAVAELRGEHAQEVAEYTTENFFRLFKAAS